MSRHGKFVFIPSGPSLDEDAKLLVKQHVMRRVATAAHESRRREGKKRDAGAVGQGRRGAQCTVAQRYLTSHLSIHHTEPDWLLDAVHFYKIHCNLDLDLYREHWLHLTSFGHVASCAIRSLLAYHVGTLDPKIRSLPLHQQQAKAVHVEALRTIRVELARLSKTTNKPGNDVVSAIVALAYRAHIVGDVEELQIHMCSLHNIVERGGGLHTVDYVLREMVCCIDTIQACAADQAPLFSTPGQEPDKSERQDKLETPAMTALVDSCLYRYPGREATIRLGEEIWSTMARLREAGSGAPCSVSFICDYLRRAQHCKTICTTGPDADMHSEKIIVECSRLSTMLVFMEPRRKLGMAAGVTENYVSKLRAAIRQPADWSGMYIPKLWILVAGAREGSGTEDGTWFEQQIRALIDAVPELQDPYLLDGIYSLFFGSYL
ncbi:hypothetical protein KCU67_g914, partial [Aureobasidium melanogenum]